MEAVQNASEVKVELFGVLIASRTRLRARLVDVGDTLQRGFSEEGRSAAMRQTPSTSSRLPSSADAYIQAAALAAGTTRRKSRAERWKRVT